MDNTPSNTPPTDPLLERARRLADEAEARKLEAQQTQRRIQEAKEKQERTFATMGAMQQASKEVDELKERIALEATELMLSQPEETESFLDNAQKQAARYERFKASKESAFAALPQTDENRKNMESIVKNAQDSYKAFYDAYEAIPNTGPWKLNTDKAHAPQWKKMVIGVKGLELNLNAYDKLTGNYAETAKIFIPDANRYAAAKKEDAEWKATIDKELKKSWEKRTAFFKENPDPLKDSDELKALRTILVDAEKLFDTYQPTFTTNETSRGITFLAMRQMAQALNVYEAYKKDNELKKQLPPETAVASVSPQATQKPEQTASKAPPVENKGGSRSAAENPFAAAPEAIAATPKPIPTPVVPDSTQKQGPEFAPPLQMPSPEAKVAQVEKKAPDLEPLTVPITAPTAAPPVAVTAPSMQRKVENDEIASMPTRSYPRMPKAGVMASPSIEPVQIPGTDTPAQATLASKPVPEAQPKEVPPVTVERPVATAEKVSEPVKATLKQDGSINVPTQETIYIAYYLPNGERQRNYVRFPANEITRWTIDGMCVAERTADGWSVHPEEGLPGALLFNVSGTTTVIKLSENARGPGLAKPNAKEERLIDPKLPTLSKIYAELAATQGN